MPQEFWLSEADSDGNRTVGTKSIAVTEGGHPVFFLRLENVVRCYIQFPPDAERDPLTTKPRKSNNPNKFRTSAPLSR